MKHRVLSEFLLVCLALSASGVLAHDARHDAASGGVEEDASSSRRREAANGIISLLGLRAPDGDIWNTLADFVLGALREEVQKTGKEQLPIPDINQDFKTKIRFVTVSGNFAARNGWFRNLSTVERTGDAKLTTVGRVYTLSCSLGVGEIKLGFDNYDVTITKADISLSGRISGSVGTNNISFVAQVDMSDGKCNATLKEIRVVELNDIKLTMTGFGVLNSLASKLANSAIEKRKPDIMKKIELTLASNVAEVLKKIKCDGEMLAGSILE